MDGEYKEGWDDCYNSVEEQLKEADVKIAKIVGIAKKHGCDCRSRDNEVVFTCDLCRELNGN